MKGNQVPDLDRWTPASSNCMGYDPDQGDFVKYEDAVAVIDPLREALQQIADLPGVSGYSEIYRIATEALSR